MAHLWSHSNYPFICTQSSFAFSKAFEMKSFDIPGFPPLLNCRFLFFFFHLHFSEGTWKLYIPGWKARSNFLINSRAGCETASGPGLGSLQAFTAGLGDLSREGAGKIAAFKWEFMVSSHNYISVFMEMFTKEGKIATECCAGFCYGC